MIQGALCAGRVVIEQFLVFEQEGRDETSGRSTVGSGGPAFGAVRSVRHRRAPVLAGVPD